MTKKKHREPVLVDCDGVVCNFMQHCLDFANGSGKTSRQWKYEEMINDSRSYPYWKEADLESEWQKEGFCSTLPLIPGSQQFIEDLRSLDVHVLFVTSPPRNNKTWPHERTEWLEKHFGIKRDEVIFAVDKRYVGGITLIDDHLKNFHAWQAYNNSSATLVAQPWNSSILDKCVEVDKSSGWYRHTEGYNVNRMENFGQIVNFVKKLISAGGNL